MTNFLDAWNVEQQSTRQTNDSGKLNFTKFPEGITKIRVLDNTPHLRWAHWLPQISRKITCAGFNCPIDELNKRAKAQGEANVYDNSRAFSFNIFNHNENRHELMEEGVTFFDELKLAMIDAVTENPGISVESFVFKIRKSRNTAGKNSWRIDLDNVSEPGANVLSAMEQKVDRAEYYKAPTPEQVQAILDIDSPDKDERIKQYADIMGYSRRDDDEQNDVNFAVEV